MSIRRSLTRVAVVALVLSSVGTGVTACTPQPYKKSVEQSGICDEAEQTVETLTDPYHLGDTTSFGDVRNLLADPSLYETSWTLQLGQKTGAMPPNLAREKVRLWLTAVLDGSKTAQDDAGLSRAATMNLAALGIQALAPGTAVDPAPFAALRTGWGYSENPDQPPSITGTALVAQGMAQSGLGNDVGDLEHFRSLASSFAGSETPEAIHDTVIPVALTLAMVESKQGFKKLFPDQDQFARWESTVEAAGATPVGFADLAALSKIHSLQETPWTALPKTFGDTMRTQGGYFTLGHGSNGDAQTTYNAATSGLPIPPIITQTMSRGLLATGWTRETTGPSLQAAFYAVSIEQMCGAEIPKLFAPLNAAVNAHAGINIATLADAAHVCWLIRTYDIKRISASANKATDLVIRDAERDAARTRDVYESAAAMFTADLCDLKPGKVDSAALDVVPMLDARDAAAARYLAVKLDNTTLAKRSDAILAKLRSGDVYSFNKSAKSPDIYSTTWAYLGSHATLQKRVRALSEFKNANQWSVNTSGIGEQPVANLSTLYFAVSLATGTSVPFATLFP